MAERRMFSKTIVQSSRFLKMPVSSRELYFQMGMSADDDGVVEAWNVMRLTNAREDDLRVLVSKGYVQVLNNEDLIMYLSDWNTNNKIRKDRYHEGLYKNLKLQILQVIDQNDNQVTTKCQPSVNQVTPEVSIGKDSIGKDNINALFESLWKLYPLKRGKNQVSKKSKTAIFAIGKEHMTRAIQRYVDDLKKQPWRHPQNGSTFFNSGYVDYLDENYEPIKEEGEKNAFNDFDQREGIDYENIQRMAIEGVNGLRASTKTETKSEPTNEVSSSFDALTQLIDGFQDE